MKIAAEQIARILKDSKCDLTYACLRSRFEKAPEPTVGVGVVAVGVGAVGTYGYQA